MPRKKVTPTTPSELKAMVEAFNAEVKYVMEDVGLSKKTAVVKVLRPSIERLNDRGFTLEQVAATLSQAGFEISKDTLKTTLSRARQE